MQFIATILALAATVVAVPGSSSDSWSCTFGEYECAWNGASIKQCSIGGTWVEVGPCPAGTTCGYDPTNDLPYCEADTKKNKSKARKRGDDDYDLGWCSAPGTYYCADDCAGIEVCNTAGELQWNGACPAGTTCQYINEGVAGEIPFCVADGW